MKDTIDIFAEGFPFLKKTAGRFATYALLFIWTIKKQYGSTDEIVTTFFYWFFRVSLVLAVVSFIGFVFFAIGYMDYLKADKRLLDDSKKRLIDWPIRVGLFNKVGLDKSVAFTIFIFVFFTFLIRPFSTQTMLTADEPLARGFLIEIGGLAIIILFLISCWKGTYIMIEREVHTLNTNNLLMHRAEWKDWKIKKAVLLQDLVPLGILVIILIILFFIKDSFQLPIIEWFKW